MACVRRRVTTKAEWAILPRIEGSGIEGTARQVMNGARKEAPARLHQRRRRAVVAAIEKGETNSERAMDPPGPVAGHSRSPCMPYGCSAHLGVAEWPLSLPTITTNHLPIIIIKTDSAAARRQISVLLCPFAALLPPRSLPSHLGSARRTQRVPLIPQQSFDYAPPQIAIGGLSGLIFLAVDLRQQLYCCVV